MIINQLNLNHLRIFECVYRTRNMTRAAEELHLTQSGVSQHIHSLEETLNIALFDRVKKRVVPTPQATTLFQRCSEGFRGIEEALESIQGGDARLAGSVTIGMPPEFGNNLVLPLLAHFGKKHPAVEFHAIYGFAAEMNELLLKGEVNFAFVDGFELDKQITIQRVYQEDLWLCASQAYLETRGRVEETYKFFGSLDYISYVQGDVILRNWFTHHLSEKHAKLNIRASVKDVQGVARLILFGLGAGILPGHLVIKLRHEGHKLHRFIGSKKKLTNTISLAYLPNRHQSHLIRSLILSLSEGLQAKRPPRA